MTLTPEPGARGQDTGQAGTDGPSSRRLSPDSGNSPAPWPHGTIIWLEYDSQRGYWEGTLSVCDDDSPTLDAVAPEPAAVVAALLWKHRERLAQKPEGQ